MPGLGDFLTQVGQSYAGTAMGLLLADENDRRQLRQQGKLQELQIKGSKELTDYQMKKQLQMWKDTNYGAQMTEIEKAGLNPGLLYGMGGSGGATTGNASGGGSVNQGHAPVGGGEAAGMAMMAANLGLLKAQKANIEANTNKTNLEANNLPVQQENIIANTKSILEGINSQKAQQAVNKAQEALYQSQDSLLKRLEWEAYNTQDARVEQAIANSRSAVENSKQEMIKTGIDEKTADEKIKLMEIEVISKLLHNELTKVNIKVGEKNLELTDAQINKMAADITQNWVKLSQEERKTFIYEKVGNFNSAQSQRTYENIITGINTVSGIFKPVNIQPAAPRTVVGGFQF